MIFLLRATFSRFRKCLKLEGGVVSNVVGYLFFEVPPFSGMILSLIIIKMKSPVTKVVNTPCFEEKEDSICVDQTWWGHCRYTIVCL